MNLPPEQLRVRLTAALLTLQRLTDHAHLGEHSHTALCNAQWHLHRELALLEENTALAARRP